MLTSDFNNTKNKANFFFLLYVSQTYYSHVHFFTLCTWIYCGNQIYLHPK